MWILTPLQPGGVTYYLNSSKEYVVGRKNCDVLLANDQSISRVHASLAVTDQALTLKDTSKYGTFVNSQRVTANATVNLKSGDSVTFGVFESKFSVSLQRPVVCSSCMDVEGKALLSQALSTLGGKLVSSWSEDCTHLVMPTAKVTIKTICALLCCRPIVKPEFFSELSKAAQQKLPPPKAESFLPELNEPSLNKEDVNLGALPARRQLFSGKTFIFLTAKQLKRLSAAVSFGGGRTQLLEEGSLPRDLLESPQNCVIDAIAGSSQLPLPSSTSQWAKSVTSIVERKGLRVIPESEVGLATIYASCDQHCNPASRASDAESVPKMAPRIPSASLSQSVAVDETVMAAASQNVTAYAVNTEPSLGKNIGDVTGVTAVGETPEKKPNQDASQLRAARAATQKTTQCVVADTMSSMYNTVEDTDSQRKKPEFRPAGNGGVEPRPHPPTSNGGAKTFQYRSPQKPKVSPKASPQKQSTLTNFFQPVGKKRPLEDDPFTEMSESKRSVRESSVNTSVTSKETPPRPDRVPAGDPQGSEDLFGARSEPQRASRAAQEQPPSRKRKELEPEIEMNELESIMSEDMDFDEQPSPNQGQQVQPNIQSLAVKKLGLNTAEASSSSSSSSKKQRLDLADTDQKPQGKKESSSRATDSQKQPIVSIKTEPVDPAENSRAASHQPSRRDNADAFDEDDASFVEDLELLQADIPPPQEETKTPLKPVAVKEEVKETKVDEDLPKKLVLVEFRSLSVSLAPPKNKPQKPQNIGFGKNFKCFRKAFVPGSRGSAPLIGGSDLLAHNRGKNSDLDEWLKDAAEDERQSRRDESIGDDLFRYNPTKLTKRR